MAVAYVQSKFQNNGSNNPSTITFGSSLTNGNKVYVMMQGSIFTGSINTTDWTIEIQNGPGGSTSTQYLLSWTVTGSPGATPPNLATGTNISFRVLGMEISGPPTIDSHAQSTSESSPIAGPTTVAANCLGMRFCGAGGGFGTYGPGTGWTNRQYDTGGSTIGDTTTSTVAAGTDLSGAVTNTAGGTSGHWMVVALKLANQTESGSGVLSFGSLAFTSSGATSHPGTGTLAFGPLAFSGSGSSSDIGTGTLAFGPFRFVASGTVRDLGTGVLSFGPFKISGTGFDLGHSPSTNIPARDTLAQEALQRLQWDQPIVDPNTGFPTPEMQRKWLRNLKIIEAQIKVNAAITPKSYIDTQITAALATAANYASSYTDKRVIPGVTTIALLPPAPLLNTRALVNDSTQTLAAGLGNTDAGGGGNTVPMYFDGAWRIG